MVPVANAYKEWPASITYLRPNFSIKNIEIAELMVLQIRQTYVAL